MNKSFYTALLLSSLGVGILSADTLSITPGTEKTTVAPGDQITFTLNTDLPADSAAIKVTDQKGAPAYYNQESTIALKRSADGRTFTAATVLKNIFYRFGSPRQGSLRFVPSITRNGKTIEGAAVPNPWRFEKLPDLQAAGAIRSADGKFGGAAHFPGSQATMKGFKKFDPQCGTIEGWIYLPPLNPQSAVCAMFIQSGDTSPWSYQAIRVTPGRALQYLVYRSKGKPTVGAVSSKPIHKDGWVYFCATYDTKAGKMKFHVDGQLAGEKDFTDPAGSTSASIELGGRIHNQGGSYQIIESANILLDEIRISNTVRDGAQVPSAPFSADANTLTLYHFDDPSLFTDAVK